MSRTTATTRRTALTAAAALATVLALGACSEGADPAEPTAAATTEATEPAAATTEATEPSGGSTTDAGAAAGNDADTEFAQMMIVHHEGAIEMAELAASDAGTEEVRALGERISAAQGPEIDLMTSWLEAWGEPTPAEQDMGGMDHGGMEMDGLSQEEAMAELESAEGTELDRRFLELMIEHHRGAIEMAEGQLDAGADPAAVALAEQIIADQEAEIAEMEELLAGL